MFRMDDKMRKRISCKIDAELDDGIGSGSLRDGVRSAILAALDVYDERECKLAPETVEMLRQIRWGTAAALDYAISRWRSAGCPDVPENERHTPAPVQPERVRAMQTHRSRCVRCGEYATKRYGHYFQCDDCDVSDVERAVGAHRPTPDKAAETWSFQVELLQRRATDAERERDEARAEVERLRQRVANLTQAPRQLAHRAGCPDVPENERHTPASVQYGQCPKCGGAEVLVSYEPEAEPWERGRRYKIRDDEHLEVLCKTCRYRWARDTLDKKRGE